VETHLPHNQETEHVGGIVIKLQERAIRIGLIITGVLLPFDVNASGSIPAPEPVSLTLLAVGAAGLGAAAWIHRHKDK
jgi:hypothetical protein